MSDLDRFELFVHVVQSGRVTRSAKLLQLTKAAVSKKIKKLEADLHVDFFSRTDQRLHLTDQGEALLQQCLR
jgi:DNA-binding transcriptional LysR family regulator